MTAFWAQELDPRLSQGDLLNMVPVSRLISPLRFLKKQTIKGGRIARLDAGSFSPDSNGVGEFLSRGIMCPGIVLTHSCELDKGNKRVLVQVAPVQGASKLEAPAREAVFSRQRYALLPLPGVPEWGDCYADLRQIATVDSSLIQLEDRLASATESGRRHLQEHLVTYFLRSDFPDPQ